MYRVTARLAPVLLLLSSLCAVAVTAITANVTCPSTSGYMAAGTQAYPQTALLTVAGTGTSGYVDGAASVARFNEPRYVALHLTTLELYVSDSLNQRIRRIATDGVVSTVAGDGVGGSVDASSGTSARLNTPYGVTIDYSRGALYVAGHAEHRVRGVDVVSTAVTTVAGNGTVGSTDGSPATSASFNSPTGLAYAGSVDRIYVADFGNGALRVIDMSSNTVSTLLTAGGNLGDMIDVAFNPTDGLLYVADAGKKRAWTVDPDSGDRVRLQNNLQACGVAVSYGTDATDKYIFADETESVVRFDSTVSGFSEGLAGSNTSGFVDDSSSATDGRFTASCGLAFDPLAGSLYVADYGAHAVRVVRGAAASCSEGTTTTTTTTEAPTTTTTTEAPTTTTTTTTTTEAPTTTTTTTEAPTTTTTTTEAPTTTTTTTTTTEAPTTTTEAPTTTTTEAPTTTQAPTTTTTEAPTTTTTTTEAPTTTTEAPTATTTEAPTTTTEAPTTTTEAPTTTTTTEAPTTTTTTSEAPTTTTTTTTEAPTTTQAATTTTEAPTTTTTEAPTSTTTTETPTTTTTEAPTTTTTEAPTATTTEAPTTTNTPTEGPSTIVTTKAPTTTEAPTTATTNVPSTTPHMPNAPTQAPTPAPRPTVRTFLSVRVSGSGWGALLASRRDEVREAVAEDLACAFAVSTSQVEVRSMRVGSLVVEAIIDHRSVSSPAAPPPPSASDGPSTPAATPGNSTTAIVRASSFSATAAVFGDNVAVLDAATIDVPLAEESSEGEDQLIPGCDKMCVTLSAIGLGLVVLLVAGVAIFVAIYHQRAKEAEEAATAGSEAERAPLKRPSSAKELPFSDDPAVAAAALVAARMEQQRNACANPLDGDSSPRILIQGPQAGCRPKTPPAVPADAAARRRKTAMLIARRKRLLSANAEWSDSGMSGCESEGPESPRVSGMRRSVRVEEARNEVVDIPCRESLKEHADHSGFWGTVQRKDDVTSLPVPPVEEDRPSMAAAVIDIEEY